MTRDIGFPDCPGERLAHEAGDVRTEDPRDSKIEVMDDVETPDGIGSVSEFDTDGAGDLVAKVWFASCFGPFARWYKVDELRRV